MEPTDFEYGEWQYSAEDPAGHLWTFSDTFADVPPRIGAGNPSAPIDGSVGAEQSFAVVRNGQGEATVPELLRLLPRVNSRNCRQ